MMKQAKEGEQGFILVTSIILLAILMGLGAAAMFKTNIEMKVSAGSEQSAGALAAAQAGLDYTYYDWSTGAGKAAFTALANAAVTTTPGNLVDFWPKSLSDFFNNNTSAIPADIDNWVNTTANVTVYDLDAGAMTLGTWNSGASANKQQVAVWVTRFAPPASATGYPYQTGTSAATACTNCTLVTYALGRSGDAYKLVREYSLVSDFNIVAFGAMVNAPSHNNDADCGTPSTTSSTTTTLTTGTFLTSHLIDATQAPGGVAMASNNGVNIANNSKPWNSQHGTGTSLKGVDPWVIFDPAKANRAPGYPAVEAGQMSAMGATVVSADRFASASTTMDYFSGGQQLFPLDVYREAANRIAGFSGESVNGYTVTAAAPLGNYTTLRTANGGNARMGTIQWPELAYNMANNIPMYGLLRFMIPTDASGSITVCGTNYQGFTPSNGAIPVDPLTQGVEAPNGKLIVYGGALFDFYYDVNGDQIYQPATERLLTQQEALSFKVNVDSPLMFNPVMDGMIARVGVPVPALVPPITQIDQYPNGSPSWDQATDAFNFIGAGGAIVNKADGEMDLIWDVDNVARNWQAKVYDNIAGSWSANVPSSGFSYGTWMRQESPAVITSTATGAGNFWSLADKTNMLRLLDYYIQTTAAASRAPWSALNLTDINGDPRHFLIDTAADPYANKASAADLYHAFLPSGYVHGWKRAMMVTGLAGDTGLAVGAAATGVSIWNDSLVGAGSPFFANRQNYFNITGVGNTAQIDVNFADIPAEMYAGGLVDMHHAVNTSGVIYTPGQLELEQKSKGTSGSTGGPVEALQYMNGIIISGNGVFMKNEAGPESRTVIAYDDTSIDRLPTNQPTPTVGRKYWQELK